MRYESIFISNDAAETIHHSDYLSGEIISPELFTENDFTITFFIFLNNHAAINLKPMNYDWIEFRQSTREPKATPDMTAK